MDFSPFKCPPLEHRNSFSIWTASARRLHCISNFLAIFLLSVFLYFYVFIILVLFYFILFLTCSEIYNLLFNCICYRKKLAQMVFILENIWYYCTTVLWHVFNWTNSSKYHFLFYYHLILFCTLFD